MKLPPRPAMRASIRLAALLVLLLPLGFLAPAAACGPDTDCVVGTRTYRIRLPPLPGGARIGAVLLSHGCGDTAAEVMANAELGDAVADLSLALVAPQSAGDVWSMPGAPNGFGNRPEIDEVADMARLLDDVVVRFPVDRTRIMAAGMSAGGMLVWNLACARADLFAGFAPISGTFWEPLPVMCPSGSATIVHNYGRSDTTVPLAGRPILDGRQGNVFEVIRRYAAFGHFGPPTESHAPGLDCERRSNPEGAVLAQCLHPGSHELRAVDVVRAWRELAALKGW